MDLEDLRNAIVMLALIAFIGATVTIALVDFRAGVDITSYNESENISASGVTITPTRSSSGAMLVGVSNICWWNESATGIASCFPIAVGTEANGSTGITGSGKITLTGNYSNNKTMVNYSYGLVDSIINISTSGIVGISNSTSYLNTIGLIMGIAVLIGIVMLAFMFMRR